jgi:hypothetical protein
MKKILYLLLILLGVISLASYFHFAGKLNIEKIVLKQQSVFNITNETFEFKLNNLNNKHYKIVINYLSSNESDIVALKKRMFMSDEYNIISQVLDEKGALVKSFLINDGSKMSGGWSNENVEWIIFDFVAHAGNSYKFKTTFQSKDDFFNKINKEIYLIEDYDSASAPWWHLFQQISLIVCILSFVGLIATYLISRYFIKNNR